MNKKNIAWVTSLLVLAALTLGAARAVIKVNDTARKADSVDSVRVEVEGVRSEVKTIKLYLKIKDPAGMKRAEELAQ